MQFLRLVQLSLLLCGTPVLFTIICHIVCTAATVAHESRVTKPEKESVVVVVVVITIMIYRGKVVVDGNLSQSRGNDPISDVTSNHAAFLIARNLKSDLADNIKMKHRITDLYRMFHYSVRNEQWEAEYIVSPCDSCRAEVTIRDNNRAFFRTLQVLPYDWMQNSTVASVVPQMSLRPVCSSKIVRWYEVLSSWIATATYPAAGKFTINFDTVHIPNKVKQASVNLALVRAMITTTCERAAARHTLHGNTSSRTPPFPCREL